MYELQESRNFENNYVASTNVVFDRFDRQNIKTGFKLCTLKGKKEEHGRFVSNSHEIIVSL